MVVEGHPNLNSVADRERILGIYESDAVDLFRVIEILADQKENQRAVQLFLVLVCLVNREYEPPSVLIHGILPFGLDALLEKLDGVDPPPFLADLVTTISDGHTISA